MPFTVFRNYIILSASLQRTRQCRAIDYRDAVEGSYRSLKEAYLGDEPISSSGKQGTC